MAEPIHAARSLGTPAASRPREQDAFSHVIGESLAIRAAIALARRVAEYPMTTVLLHGETGTGKELFSRGIHYAGNNGTEPFVSVNCSAIPETLLESELFGHERGAFTDARAQKRGLLELAGRGTLFLDEVDELPLSVQPKLLRVLEERRVRRLGGLDDIAIRCRIVAATNSDLMLEAAGGRFREDLYYRLNVFRIELPPLRMREDDLEQMAHAFVAGMCRDHGLRPKALTAGALDALRLHPWPGNIRELRNAIERAVIVAEDDDVRADHIVLQRRTRLPAEVATSRRPVADIVEVPPSGLTLRDAERALYDITHRLAGGNHSRMARMLGVSRPTVIRRLREFGLTA
ncbi:MAG: sigma 54-interacting transcriptional regulator [Gemmatimonadetes bacterium]|nr:sigma 54-interacting transcriptional regulator [Gemmatimonadota bacterium]